MKIPVKGTNFVKDTSNGALLTTNRSVLLENEARKRLSNRLSSKDDEINKLKMQVQEINEDVSEIKSLLKQLINQRV
jgi:peptidoglycan hydrolase CwlO-like protein